jgi:hypothetical protein
MKPLMCVKRFWLSHGQGEWQARRKIGLPWSIDALCKTIPGIHLHDHGRHTLLGAVGPGSRHTTEAFGDLSF